MYLCMTFGGDGDNSRCLGLYDDKFAAIHRMLEILNDEKIEIHDYPPADIVNFQIGIGRLAQTLGQVIKLNINEPVDFDV